MSLIEILASLGGIDPRDSVSESDQELGYADKLDHAARSSANNEGHRRHFRAILGPQVEPNDAASERLRIVNSWIREHGPIQRAMYRRKNKRDKKL